MQKPEPVAAVRNTYVTEQVWVSLAGRFSTAVRDAGFAQWKHVQGEVNAIHITSLTGTTMGFLASLHAKRRALLLAVITHKPCSESLKWLVCMLAAGIE